MTHRRDPYERFPPQHLEGLRREPCHNRRIDTPFIYRRHQQPRGFADKFDIHTRMVFRKPGEHRRQKESGVVIRHAKRTVPASNAHSQHTKWP